MHRGRLPPRCRIFLPILAFLLVFAAARHAVAAGSEAPAPPGPASSFLLEGALRHPGRIGAAELRGLPATTLVVSLATDRGRLGGSWTGVLLWTLLERAGVRTKARTKNAVLLHTLVVTGSDGYAVALSFGEIDPRLGASPTIIAYAHNGKPLPSGEGLRLIVPGDKVAARAVRDVASIDVR